jgi:metallophosphoesterase superfamily enzyme
MNGPVPGLSFDERALYVDGDDVLVLADLHVGRAESSAVTLPMGEAADVRDRIDRLLARFRPAVVVVAGDVVHTFGGVSDRSRTTLDELAAACRDSGATLELVAGNHDTSLATAWDGPIHDGYAVGGANDDREVNDDRDREANDDRDREANDDRDIDRGDRRDGEGNAGDDGGNDRSFGDASRRTVVCHGHDPPDCEADRYVFGHLHPTVGIEGDRRPCFLYGKGVYNDADVICLPAFTRFAPGVPVTDMDARGTRSPLVTDIDRLRPIVYDPDADETFRFPALGELRGRL